MAVHHDCRTGASFIQVASAAQTLAFSLPEIFPQRFFQTLIKTEEGEKGGIQI